VVPFQECLKSALVLKEAANIVSTVKKGMMRELVLKEE